MKPVYLPPIDAEGGAYRERSIEPRRTALLNIDMQNMEVSREIRDRARQPGTPESRKASYYERVERLVIPNQQRLQAAARKAGLEVIFTTIESLTRDGRDRSLDHKISRLHAPKGSWEGRVIDEVAPVGDEIIIPKTSSGIFNSTNIEYVLRNLGIEYLIVYGVLTDQCVESAIRDAADRGFMVTQIEDCCASYTPEQHEHSIHAMKGHYCRTRSTDEMIAELERLTTGAQVA
ncbi:cysteine hydrolase family protein [Hyalangium rubrum]|uniref:Isochorismatase family cysteine hydrolase n=1 Tax=Hyalangium rubrum TaxID=3103134 RepID=A0ABU5H7D1_9BACT|nr:isochorismatase family cysteine hydrolase [Hyalangium sp. s54d21]MDY7229370.1 isochorismatase family cysteine hydrolase [Hyalangium sp. s54d21]